MLATDADCLSPLPNANGAPKCPGDARPVRLDQLNVIPVMQRSVTVIAAVDVDDT